MCVMRADQEQHNGDRQEKLLGGSILVAIVDLLPHVQVIVGASIEIKRDAADVVEHKVRASRVGAVDKGPGGFLGHARDDVKEYLADEDEDKMDSPGALCIDPLGIKIGQGRLVTQLLQRLGGLLVDQTATAAAASFFCVEGHCGRIGRGRIELAGPRAGNLARSGGTVGEYGRQFGGVWVQCARVWEAWKWWWWW